MWGNHKRLIRITTRSVPHTIAAVWHKSMCDKSMCDKSLDIEQVHGIAHLDRND